MTSTRLQVDRIAPSATPSSSTRRRSAAANCPFPKATRSRTSTGAVRWFSPTSTILRDGAAVLTSERLPVLPEREHVHADERDDDHREPRDRERRRPAPAPARRHAALEEHDVDAPRDERED